MNSKLIILLELVRELYIRKLKLKYALDKDEALYTNQLNISALTSAIQYLIVDDTEEILKAFCDEEFHKKKTRDQVAYNIASAELNLIFGYPAVATDTKVEPEFNLRDILHG